MKIKITFLVLFLLINLIIKSQNNDFKIGILFSNSMMNQSPIVNGPYLGSNQLSFSTKTTYILGQNYNTSPLNIISEDGFNSVYFFEPNSYQMSENQYRKTLDLIKANNLTTFAHSQLWYVPNYPNSGGRNVYDNNLSLPYNPNSGCSNYQNQAEKLNKARPNYLSFSNIYKDPLYSNVIWGHDIANEMNFAHPYNYSCEPLYLQQYMANGEIPPSNVSDAIAYFKSNLIPSSQKTVVAVVNHLKSINSNSNDAEYNGTNEYQNSPIDYDPQVYLDIENKPDILMDGSYYQYPVSDWWQNYYLYSNIYNVPTPNTNYGKHYLGKFASFDFFRKKGYNQIQTWISCERYWPPDEDHPNGTDLIAAYNTTNIYNANYIWLQSYTSIIHGCQGIWLYVMEDYDASTSEQNNKIYMFNQIANPPAERLDRYNRQYFSSNYKDFISNLGKELRYLKNRGFLSTDPNSILYTKTNQVDPNCIVPPASSYIPTNFPTGYGPGGALPTDLRTENYGLRYTIRTNGTTAVMIISNPLNIPITATLNFDNILNPIIDNSTGVKVLFESFRWSPTSSSYKTAPYRNSGITLNNDPNLNTVNLWYNIMYSGNKNLTLTFGPSDVHVLEFITSPVGDYKNGWDKVWSNENLSFIGSYQNGWTISDNDKFIPGDFDGDGAQELLCIQYLNNNAYAGLYKFQNNNWNWVWDNSGNGKINSLNQGWSILQTDKYYVGKFSNSGRDEILCVQTGNNAYIGLYQFNNGNWQWIWDNPTGSNLNSYRGNITIGDYDHDGYSELFGVGNSDMKMFNYQSNSWVAAFTGSTSHPMWPYRNNLKSGDFDGQDGQDDLLGIASWATVFYYNTSNNSWNWGESSGGTNMGGWTLPAASNDICLTGNIDGDIKSEILWIRKGEHLANSMEAKTGSFYSNWSNGSNFIINDWINEANSNYLLIKAVANEPKYLIAYKKTSCQQKYLLSMFKSVNGSNKSTNYQSQTTEISTIEEMVHFYPNPSEGKVFVNSEKSGILSVEIYNNQGKSIFRKTCYSEREILIDISDQPDGIYLAKLVDEKGKIFTKKLVLSK
ncbi:MAG: T9SS type A sorting domain-containing protein [Bacteroidia bacterium]|nr:T9SS type A sorting domain-containing protein [Bacteroidia bacterium]